MSTSFNYKFLFKILGVLLLVECVFMLLSMGVGLLYGEGCADFLPAIATACVLGTAGLLAGRRASFHIGKREGSLVVTAAWLMFTLVGLLPFWTAGHIPSFTDAFFETMSGFTTTGSSILTDIESLPYGILFWRAMTHWMGGLGIIGISMALFPLFGISNMQLFSAEATGPTKDKIHPKISETAKRLFIIYVVLTVAETVLLRLAGMGWFDAVCQSFSTIATGGFSTKQASIAYWDSPLIEYIIAFFMTVSGVNFSLYYFLFKLRGRRVLRDEELRCYLLILAVFVVVMAVANLDFTQPLTWASIEETLRHSLFMGSTIMTTTGFASCDYMVWPQFTWIMLLLLMLTGASAGSTAGGIKVSRVVLTGKFCYSEFKRMTHPNAVFPVRYNGHVVRDEVVKRTTAFVMLYGVITLLGVLALSCAGLGFMEAVSCMVNSIGNVGIAFGNFGAGGSFADLSDFCKWVMSFAMLIGRLEIFTVLIILTPAFWKR